MFYAYLFKNLVNGKIYVGETGSPKRRYRDHISTASSKGSFAKIKKQSIHRAIAKYGESSFEFSIIDQFATERDALEAEVRYIKQFKSNNRKFGYNLTSGGDGAGGLNKKITNREAISLIKEYVKNEVTLRELSLSYNISRDSVAKIIKGEIYVDLTISDKLRKEALAKIKSRDKSKKTNPEIISSILKDSGAMSNKEIANKYKLGIDYVRKIIKGSERAGSSLGKIDSEELALQILEDYSSGNFKAKDLSERYHVSIDSVRGVLSGSTTRHLNVDRELMLKVQMASKKNIGCKLNEDSVQKIFEKYAMENCSLKEIAEEFGLRSLSTIVWMLKRKTWEDVPIPEEILSRAMERIGK